MKLRAKCFSVAEILLMLREKVSVHPYALKVGPGRRDGDRFASDYRADGSAAF